MIVGEGVGEEVFDPFALAADDTPVYDIPEVDSPLWGSPRLPEWLTEFRPHQIQAIGDIMEAYRDGAEVVWLDAPTGSGKTLIAEGVRRLLRLRALYICSSISLQTQFQRDYGYAKVLKGRTNYPTLQMPFPSVTCGDCTKDGRDGKDAKCLWCPNVRECPYERAKAEALAAPLAVVNTAYFLAEANYIGNLSNRPLVIVDECDILERELMGFVEFGITPRLLERMHIAPPKKGSHRTTIKDWLEGDFSEALRKLYVDTVRADPSDIRNIRDRQHIERLSAAVRRIAPEIATEQWVRDSDQGKPLTLKPVTVTAFGQENLWRHGLKWLCMSATIISPDELGESLGLERPAAVVRVPMTFPVENRTIYVAPVANMVASEKDSTYPRMASAIGSLLSRHPTERCLVHTVSYDLAGSLYGALRKNTDRTILQYRSASERENTLARFLRTRGAVLLAPSFDRGIDLKGDDCRVCIVAKIPYPYLGDRQISDRTRLPGGQQWYSVQTIRSLVQMTGRGVRSEDDWCITYILDGQFGKNIWKKNRGLLPEWWKEALDQTFNVREILK